MASNIFKNGFPALVKKYEKISSTNDVALKYLLEKGEESNGAVFVADFQEKGRGRIGRSWFAKKGASLLMSYIFVPPENFKWNLLSLAAGLSCAKAAERYKSVKVQIKWPNDIIYENKKMGGILSETKAVGNKIIGVVIGIGINIKGNKEDFPVELCDSAISLEEASSSECEVEEFLKFLFEEIPDKIDSVYEKSQIFLKELEEYLIHRKGDEIEISFGEKLFKGNYERLNENGEIVLNSCEGKKTFSCGEIVRMRALK
ncbi:MAG: biotin--[acetyl-CoA-carboxylase] ligase [Acidobacteria bacterium]|nr:biotin--[acetyl-CoA-carboxylase] ligase [Acidobacteriota bacterium]